MTTPLTDQEFQDILDALDHTQDSEKQRLLNQGLPTHQMNLDMELTPWLVDKVRASDDYAQNLYAAMCNRDWQELAVWPILKNETWSCSWRMAGGIVADLRGSGSYIDWYCSGIGAADHPTQKFVNESVVTDEIRQDLARIGWRPIDNTDEEL